MVASSSPIFTDIQGHWARLFIEGLAQLGIVRGFADQTFRPNRVLTRAELAAMLQRAFPRPARRPAIQFVDVPNTHWAAEAIRKSYESGFLSGFPERQFRPDETLTRLQGLVALVSGLGLSTTATIPLARLYQDSGEIPAWATAAIAAATEAGIVVNAPNLQQLRSTQPATRADIAAFIYQCLVHLGQAPAIESAAIVRWVPTVAVSHTREFRAAWISTVWNLDWPSKSNLTVEQQQAELVEILDRLQALNFNAVILQVRPEGDAIYPSTFDPWSHWLTGTQGKAPEPFYDPLAFAIAACRQRNLEFHAWFNPFRAKTAASTVNAANHFSRTNPDVVYPWGTQMWMDPSASVVQDRAYQVILDVVKRYDLDGVHVDDYFYPYPIRGQNFPDGKLYQAYQASGGTLSVGDWRRDNINRWVQRVFNSIRAEKPHVKFGISPFGIYRPGQPPPARGMDAYEQLYADALKWLQLGWVDYMAPQLYWKIEAPGQSYPMLLKWWTEVNSQQRHIYSGNNLAQIDEQTWPVEEVENQIRLTRELRNNLSLGNIFFGLKALTRNSLGLSDRLTSNPYQPLALPPTMAWLNSTPAPLPMNVKTNAGQVTWATSPAVRSWTLYQQDGSNWVLRKILPATVTTIALPAGTYALCSVNRLANESAGVVVTVKA